MIPLVCGDPGNPENEAASFTRFVLPFSYRRVPCPDKTPSHVYTPSAHPSRWRRHYLTVETAAVLFDRAQSFELDPVKDAREFTISRDQRTFTVRVAAPRLLLFEWPDDAADTTDRMLRDPLSLGFLILEACFPDRSQSVSLDDLLAFNEHFRYWQRPYEGHEKHYRKFLSDCPLDLKTRRRTVGEADLTEIYFNRWASLLEWPVKSESGKLWSVCPDAWHCQAQAWVNKARENWDSGWIAYADSRTYVWTCAILQDGGNTLKGHIPRSNPPLELWQYGHWIKLLNVDGPERSQFATHQSTQFERDWAKPRTYTRWAHKGTLYGFNYHAGALLGPKTGPPIWQHFGEIYFDQILLLLYMRIVSFSFSRQLSRISAQARNAGASGQVGREKWQAAFRELRWNFALFTNLYEFPLLSNQQQGLEIYEIARKHMDVAELFREIQSEIQNSHEYLVMVAGQEQTEMSTRLTVVATIGLFFGLVTSALGMGVIVQQYVGKSPPYSKEWELIALVSILFFLIMCGGIAYAKLFAAFFDKLVASVSSPHTDRYDDRPGPKRGV